MRNIGEYKNNAEKWAQRKQYHEGEHRRAPTSELQVGVFQRKKKQTRSAENRAEKTNTARQASLEFGQ